MYNAVHRVGDTGHSLRSSAAGAAGGGGVVILSASGRWAVQDRYRIMTTLELKLDLPDRLAREAQAAGLLTPKALSQLLKDAMRRRAAQALLDGAARASEAGSKPLPMKAVQAEVNAVRRERRARVSSGA